MVKLYAPHTHEVLYPIRYNEKVLYLNRFRGEPARSKFVWPFTPKHKSSPGIATTVGSVLHYTFMEFQPAHT